MSGVLNLQFQVCTPRFAPACHGRGEYGGVAAGSSAGGVRRAAAGRGEGQASREEKVVPPRAFGTAPRPLRRSTACRSSASREADFVDLFVERRECMLGVELLVRAKVNRALDGDDADKLPGAEKPDAGQTGRQASECARQGQQAGCEGRATDPPGHRRAALPQGRVADETQSSRRGHTCPRDPPRRAPNGWSGFC